MVAMPRGMRLLGLHRAKEGGPPAAVEWRRVVPREDDGKEEVQVPRLDRYVLAPRSGKLLFHYGEATHQVNAYSVANLCNVPSRCRDNVSVE